MTQLIPIAKGDEYLEVHPSCVAAHKAVGWTECEPRAEAEEAPAAKPGRKSKSAD